MQHTEFLALPAAKKIVPVVLLAGDERFFREEALRAIESALGPQTERVEFRAAARGGSEAALILDEARSTSLFSKKKLILVREAQHFISERSASIAEIAAAGAKAGAGLRVVLALDSAGLDRRTKAAKEVEKAALLVECKPLFSEPPPWARAGRPWDSPLCAWVVERAKSRKKRLSAESAYRLTQLTGNDLHEIAATIEKLDLLLGDRESATDEDIEAVAGRTRKDDAFAVADAVGKRDGPRALALLQSLFRNGIDDRKGGAITDAGTIALFVFGRIYAKIDEVRRVRSHLDRGGSRAKEAVAEAALVAPFLAERALADADRFRAAEMPLAFRWLLESDLAIKGEPPGPRMGLERLIVRLCAPAAAPGGARGNASGASPREGLAESHPGR